MADPTPMESLSILVKIAEETPMTGPVRDEVRRHIQNVKVALEPKTDA